jgi:3-oxoacyl-[acyl-carrier protein] reductase
VGNRFADRLVLITGAAGGMGRAFALAFAGEGARLVLTDIEPKGLEESASLARAKGAECSTHKVNLAVEREIHQFATDLRASHLRLDVLINNAGLAYGEIARGFDQLTQEKWLHYFNVNTVSPLLLAQALRPLIALARGVILNVTSMASYMPATAYGITKSALNSITYGMATHFGADGIRVNAIAPGLMETPASVANLDAETHKRIQSQQMLKLDGKAEDIAALALFLASDEARFIDCEIVHCDAGNRVRGWRG